MGIPASVNTEPERVIFGKAQVVRTSFVQEGQRPGGRSVPSMCWDYMESGLQLRLKQLFSIQIRVVDLQLEKCQRFDQFVESVLHQKLSGPVSSPFQSPKSHRFSMQAQAAETNRGNLNAVKGQVGMKGARDGTQSYGCLARGYEERKGIVIDGKHCSARGTIFVRHAI